MASSPLSPASPSFQLPHALLGDGPHKVIAVHGWFADRSAYAPVLADLDRASFQYAVVDLRGYGEAKDAAGAYSTSEGAADVVALADRLGWDRFSLIGHSMGACVAQRVLAIAPHRVRRLVGVSPVPASGLDLPPEQWELFAEADRLPGNRRAIIDITTGGTRPAAWLDRMVERSLDVSDAKAFRAWLDSWAREDFHDRVEGSTVPALAVVGALDPALGVDLMRRTWLRWYARAELTELSQAGHYAMDETPLALLSAVEDFLRADGESADSERADGESADSERADGESAGGESAGESRDGSS
ncbi:alpha/beta hydrolase [Streptomyces sp. NPDC050147]|uniref:alpha/beta fold hydrolase n=1 Tax=Streptomyces sp. NPDC050147 TaxID=3155513 RepID=UPI003412106B